MNTKTLYFIKQIAFVALLAMGFMLVPGTGTALAQKGVEREITTQDMISFATNLRSAGTTSVSGETVSDKGTSNIANGASREGAQKDDTFRRDLSNSFSAFNQLPCTPVDDANLSDKTFAPGVYCLSSAVLTSRLVLDAQNNESGSFIFRVAGGLTTKSGSSIALANGAVANNVFFISDDSAIVAEGTDFKGSIIARNNISIGADAMVDGRVLSVKGNVELSANSVLGPQQTGILEICKNIAAGSGTGLDNRTFRFQLDTGQIVEAPTGGCSGPIPVLAGNRTITELQTGNNTFGGGTFNGNFQLTAVNTLGDTPTTAIVSRNLPQFQAVVNVREGTIANQTRIEFVNRFGAFAAVEICKEALDAGVTGFFNFTINEIPVNQTTGAAPQPQFTAPVGQCTSPISVFVPSSTTNPDGTTATPRTGQVTIRELPRAGFTFTSATAVGPPPAMMNRLVAFTVDAPTNTGGGTTGTGGTATVIVVAGTADGGRTDAGAVANQTQVFFNNRSNAAVLKICKIAGPGITQGAPFSFTVTGTAPLAPLTAPATGGTAGGTAPTGPGTGGTATTGSTLQGGTQVTRDLTVPAGPAAQGGFCVPVAGTFVVGSTVTITEQMEIANLGQVRVSRITSNSGITAPVTRDPNVPFFPGSGANTTANAGGAGAGGMDTTRRVTVPVIAGTTEVEFVNIAFFATQLKICKVAGTGVTPNGTTPVTFTVTTDTAGGLLPAFTSTVNVTPGTASTGPGTQNGNCDFATGPFGGVTETGATATTNGMNSFNFNSGVTIQETAGVTGTFVPTGGITSPTTGVVSNTGTRTATITNLQGGVNEVFFVNNLGTGPTIKSRKRVRFF